MPFQIPEDLTRFMVSALESFRAEANTEYQAILADVTPDSVTTEQLERLEALRNFDVTVDDEIAARSARLDRFAALTAEPAAPSVDGGEVLAVTHTPQTSTVVEVTEGSEALTAAATQGASTVIVPKISDIAGGASVTEALTASTESAPERFGTLVAAADVPGFVAGAELGGMLDVAKAFVARTSSYRGLGQGIASHGVAVFKRDYPEELTVFGESDNYDQAIMEGAAKESRLPGGSLVAANHIRPEDIKVDFNGQNYGKSLTAAVGWCAPSTTIYDTCLQVTATGLASFPEVAAPRGGVRHNTGLDFSTVFGDGTGYFNYTESQIISGVSKPCLTINCPSFTDTRLGVTGLCLTGNILQNRAYPEYVATFIRGALAASAHQINMLQIAAVVTGSTAVDLTGSAPFVGDGTVVSQVFAAVDLAIMDIKYRLRLDPGAQLEVKLPFWLLPQMRADWSRRNAESNPNMADAAISAWFSVRDAVPDFVYDWQDAFANSNVGPGSSTPITALPTQLVFLVYPTGTWVRLASDVITLNSIYDSTKLASNQVTQLFTEQGWAMAQMCPLSRAYTVNLCPSGETGAQRTSSNTITC